MIRRSILNAAIAVLVAASFAFTAIADSRVTKINGDDISGDVEVVTDVDLSGIGGGVDTNAVRDIVDASFEKGELSSGTQNVNRVVGSFDNVSNRVAAIEGKEVTWDGKQDKIDDLDTIRSGASAGATAYQKPTGGIPKADLSSTVQASLGKADSALQTEKDPSVGVTNKYVYVKGKRMLTEQQSLAVLTEATNATIKSARDYTDNLAVVGNGFLRGTPFKAGGTAGEGFRSVEFCANRFVAGDINGNVWISESGSNGWRKVTATGLPLSGSYFRAFRHSGAGKVVGVAADGHVATSSDSGATWRIWDTLVGAFPGQQLYDIDYNGATGEWIAVRDGGITIAKWGETTRRDISSIAFRQVACSDDGTCVLGSATAKKGLWYLPAGGNVPVQSNVTNANFRCVGYANGLFVAGAFTGSSSTPDEDTGIWISRDGRTWRQVDANPDPYYACTFADGQWVITSTYRGHIRYSYNGQDWTACDRPGTVGVPVLSLANGRGLTLFCNINDGLGDGIYVAKIGRYVHSNWFYSKDEVEAMVSGIQGTTTNAVIDIIHATVDGEARPLPKYLHALDFADSYTNEAAAYYRSRGNGKVDGGCSAVRKGGFLYRNFDYPFDDRAEFIVKMSAGPNRFASVGVAQVGTNLTEAIVTSGKPEFSARYKWLPGATVDGINEHGVVAEINVVDTPVTGWHTNATSEAIHPLGAIRWILDHATNAQHGATYIAANIRFPAGWVQNFHYMIADAESTYIVENGTATDGDEYHEPDEPVTMTNFQLSKFPWDGMGMERFGLLLGGANITNAWYTRAYHRETNPPWISDLAEVIAYTNEIFDAWAAHDKEYFRGKTNGGESWWQSVHTSVYDITNRVLRVAVQETDDWYTFQVPSSGAKVDAYTKAETDEKLAGKANKNGDSNEDFSAKDIISVGTLFVASIQCGNEIHADGDINCYDEHYNLHHLSAKADRAESGHGDEIATLDADGNPTRSGIAKTNVATKSDMERKIIYDEENKSGSALGATSSGIYRSVAVGFNSTATAYNSIALGMEALAIKDYSVAIGSKTYAKHKSSLIIGAGSSYYDSHGDGTINFNAGDSETNSADAAKIFFGDKTLRSIIIEESLQAVVPNLSTNITAEVYIAATNACANLGIDPALIPQGGTLGTVGGLLVALAAAVALLRKKTKLLKSDGTAEDDFATELMGKQVAKEAIDAMTPYAQIAASASSINRSVKVYTATDTLPSPIPLPQIPTTGIIDLEVWIEAGSTAPSNVTFSPGIIPKDGKALEFAANSTNIIHLTARGGASHYTAVAAAFKAQS